MNRIFWFSLTILATVFTGCNPAKDQDPLSADVKTPTRASAQGGESSGGGGGFVESKFFDVARRISVEATSEFVTDEGFRKFGESLSTMLSTNSLTIEISDEHLSHPEKGSVDALNFADSQRIKLYRNAWKDRFDRGVDTRLLVCHELAGVLRVPDDKYQFCSRFFPVDGLGPSLYSARVECFPSAGGFTLNEDAENPLEPVSISVLEGDAGKWVSMSLASAEGEDASNETNSGDLGVQASQVIEFAKTENEWYSLHIRAAFHKDANEASSALGNLARIEHNALKSRGPVLYYEADLVRTSKYREFEVDKIVAKGMSVHNQIGSGEILLTNTEFSNYLQSIGVEHTFTGDREMKKVFDRVYEEIIDARNRQDESGSKAPNVAMGADTLPKDWVNRPILLGLSCRAVE